MHVSIEKVLAEALKDLDSLGDKAIKSRILGLKDEPEDDEGAEELQEMLEKPEEEMGDTSDMGGTKITVVKDLSGKPALDEDKVTPDEEEITDDMLMKLKELLGK